MLDHLVYELDGRVTGLNWWGLSSGTYCKGKACKKHTPHKVRSPPSSCASDDVRAVCAVPNPRRLSTDFTYVEGL